jgi:histidyl-tRNA synthetase
MGDVTLFDFLDTHGLLPAPRTEADVAVIPVTEDLSGAARSVAGKLRHAGWRTSVPVEVRKLGREIARASQAGVRAIVIIGPGEWAEGNVTVRDMVTGDQQVVAAASATEAVTRMVKQPR